VHNSYKQKNSALGLVMINNNLIFAHISLISAVKQLHHINLLHYMETSVSWSDSSRTNDGRIQQCWQPPAAKRLMYFMQICHLLTSQYEAASAPSNFRLVRTVSSRT